jgi:hypothetical protein
MRIETNQECKIFFENVSTRTCLWKRLEVKFRALAETTGRQLLRSRCIRSGRVGRDVNVTPELHFALLTDRQGASSQSVTCQLAWIKS